MKVAVVGTGIAGMVAARELAPSHELTVYEAGDRLGGHTNTVEVDSPSGPVAVDTGFIVFNEKTYPGFCALLESLGVAWKESDMSFSVRCDRSGLEYNGTSIDGMLAKRTNLLRPDFWRMVRDILRFYREAPDVLAEIDDSVTLGQFLADRRYSKAFVDKHLIPMGAAVWSSTPETMEKFPLRFLLRFFDNHGFLQVDDRPQWLVVEGGSRRYVDPLVAPYRDRIRLGCPVIGVRRCPEGVLVRERGGSETLFDRVVLATHADTSLRMLTDASPLEREVLGAFAFQPNEAVLHTDASLMPRAKRAWASWNYHVGAREAELPTVTYWMNRLQGLDTPEQYFVTLNRTDEIDPAKVLRVIDYDHPIYTREAVRAQARHAEVDGLDRVHFCGAYWHNGFHEDGVQSGLRVARRFAEELAA